MQKGFTLLEALITITLVGVIGLSLTELLSRTFRGNTKTQVIGLVKQNGQSALNIMDQTIRFSGDVECPPPSVSSDSIVIKTQGGSYIKFKFDNSTSPTSIIQQNFTLLDPLTAGSFCTNPPPSPQTITLTDTDPAKGVAVEYPASSFKKITGAKGDIVIIKFELKPANPGAYYDSQLGGTGTIPFETTIVLRK